MPALTTNGVIGFPRWTSFATFSSSGSFNASYPVTNLGVLPLSRVARTSTAATANTTFTAIMDKPRPIQLIALINHNATLDATYRVRLWADVAKTQLLYDSGTGNKFWPQVYDSDLLEWESDQWWSGQYSTEEIAGYRATLPIILPQVYSAYAIQVDVVDTANPDGYFQIGFMEIAQVWQVGVNFQPGAQYGFRARTQTIEALGGVKYFDRRDKPRQFIGSIDFLDRDEAKAKAFEHQRQLDLDLPFLWIPDPSETLNLLRDCIFARNIDLGLLAYAQPTDSDSVPFKFEEVL